MFPSLSRISEPLLGADQPTASSGPPRDKRSRGYRLVPRGGRPPEVIRIRVLTTATAATPFQPHPRATAMSGTTTPVAPRRTSLLLRRHPKSLQEPSHSTRLVPAPRRAASRAYRAPNRAKDSPAVAAGPHRPSSSGPQRTSSERSTHNQWYRRRRRRQDQRIPLRDELPRSSPAHCSRAPAVREGAQSRSCGFGRQHDHTPVGTPKRDSDGDAGDPHSPEASRFVPLLLKPSSRLHPPRPRPLRTARRDQLPRQADHAP